MALVSLNEAQIRAGAKRRGLALHAELDKDEHVLHLIEKRIKRVNQKLASFETIKAVGIVPEEFSVENGLLTPTFKIKRDAVTKRYCALIEKLYTAFPA